MNIIVINGSPSGSKGVSAQYSAYLARNLAEHALQVVEVAREIHKLERDLSRFDAVVTQIAAADAVIWCFPVYFMLVPAQLKRFVELLLERVGPSAFAGKVATALSSSAHFYDHTAHDYVRGVSADLGMSFVQGFSAGRDLLSDEGRANLLAFAKSFLRHAKGELPVDGAMPPVRWTPPVYDPQLPPPVSLTGRKRIVVITDASAADRNLGRMIDVFERSVSHAVDRLDINALRIDGGCLGCMRCADDGVCGYKDEYAAAFDDRVAPADVVIYAGVIRDRFFSARFKTFIDRYFRNGHRPLPRRQLVGYLVSGPLSQLPTMNEVLEANVQMARGQRLGTVTDEHPDPDVTTARLRSMARAVDAWLEEPWFLPATFLGVAGTMIFRDLVYENKGVLSADHRYYLAHGLYDFPQRKLRNRLFMAFLLFCKKIPFLAARLKTAMRTGQAGRYRRLVETAQPRARARA